MEMRSNRYDDDKSGSAKLSRVERNKHLYDDINMKIGVDSIENYENSSKIDLSSLNDENTTRSNYQKIKEYKNIFTDNVDKNNEKVEEEQKVKNFDINVVLEEAKKNRNNDDKLEKKRKLDDEEYNILSNLNKKYLHKKDFTDEDSEELKELIDTITSKTLVDDVKNANDKELLSDLLATTIDIKLEKELSKNELGLDNFENIEFKDKQEDSFYTNSMEIDKEDLVDNNETDEDDLFENIGTTSGLKIFIIVFVILVIASVLIYFLLKKIGISI